jgi:UDP-GlcNAc:undecaprenyl-phosphate/decaprenyl-phosphate GlcNAc-1-phosphate transferase
MLALSIVFVAATAAGLCLTPMVIRLAVAWELFDAPHGDRRVHTEPLPRVGGVAVFGAVAVGLVAMALASLSGMEWLGKSSGFMSGLLFGSGIIFATGLIDDLRGLRPSVKLVAQVIAALVVYAYGFRIDVITLGAAFELDLGWATLPLTLFWVVGVTNAFNLIDGLDGLATGIAVIALSATMLISGALGNVQVMFLSVALIGALIAFLRYNFSPAQIFLGDSGSLFIGFMLAVLTVYGAQAPGAPGVLVLVPLFALAVPLVDTALAMARRFLRGMPLSQADGRHIHHRLLALGFSHRHAVIVLYVAAVFLAMVGLSLAFAPPPSVILMSAGGSGVAICVLLYGLRRLQYHEFAEASTVLLSGYSRARRVIRDGICAQDVANVVAHAGSWEQLAAILEDNAATFGFLHMEVCPEGDSGPRPLVLFHGHAARAWKLDVPVTPHDFAGGVEYVLRIWCNPGLETQPQGAERVARSLGPVIEHWIRTFDEEQARAGDAVVEGGSPEPRRELGDRARLTVHRGRRISS